MATNIAKRFYRSLYMIRKVEEEISRVYPSDKIKSPVHLSIGQEAISVGICEALRADDIVFGTYRGHAMYLSKGGDLNKMIAELYGKETGCTKGRGGSMHLIDITKGVMGTSAIVGTTIPLSVGYAYAQQYRNSDSIVVSFFGDGAVDEGAFHESLNFAALKRLPILFVCENNLYAIHSHHLNRHRLDNICERAKCYGMPAAKIDNQDIFEIYKFAKEAAANLRKKNYGPAFLECVTYRWKEHVGPYDDFNLGYRSKDEMQYWLENDQLKKIKKLLSPEAVQDIESQVNEEIRQAFLFAEESPFPQADDLYRWLFKE